jgi:hypothetical protein
VLAALPAAGTAHASTLVYVCGKDLCTSDDRGRGRERLTRDGARVGGYTRPTIDRAGPRIAFKVGDLGRVFTTNTRARRRTRIPPAPDGARDAMQFDAAISPDGRHVAWVERGLGGDPDQRRVRRLGLPPVRRGGPRRAPAPGCLERRAPVRGLVRPVHDRARGPAGRRAAALARPEPLPAGPGDRDERRVRPRDRPRPGGGIWRVRVAGRGDANLRELAAHIESPIFIDGGSPSDDDSAGDGPGGVRGWSPREALGRLTPRARRGRPAAILDQGPVSTHPAPA